MRGEGYDCHCGKLCENATTCPDPEVMGIRKEAGETAELPLGLSNAV